jgi:hypothetical protein
LLNIGILYLTPFAAPFVKRLIENAQVKKFLHKRYPEIQEELMDLAGMEVL